MMPRSWVKNRLAVLSIANKTSKMRAEDRPWGLAVGVSLVTLKGAVSVGLPSGPGSRERAQGSSWRQRGQAALRNFTVKGCREAGHLGATLSVNLKRFSESGDHG